MWVKAKAAQVQLLKLPIFFTLMREMGFATKYIWRIWRISNLGISIKHIKW